MPIELIENINSKSQKVIDAPKIDGTNAKLLEDYLVSKVGEVTKNCIMKNAYKSIQFFANTSFKETSNLSKILAIGRVQSGKTSFFIAASALAFDNGYDIAVLIGGTKNALKDQNLERVKDYFSNNEGIIIRDINDATFCEIENAIKIGKKVILVSLKNAAENANLGKAYSILLNISNCPTLVIDDEGDEYSPGAPKLIKKNGRSGANHDKIRDIIYSLSCCTYLSVTATPQANFLISTIDAISPDYALLVEPGNGYTGGNAFHDTIDNPHVDDILDTDDFKTSIPISFMNALYFFIFSACLKRAESNYEPFSMLVHPSSLTRVHKAIIEKIKMRLDEIIYSINNCDSIDHNEILDKILEQKEQYFNINGADKKIPTDSNLLKCVQDVTRNIDIFEFNISSDGKEDIQREKENKSLYKVYVGGNMLGRGLTIKNLCCSYIYRDSKVQAVDTLYQRARWLGYKSKYFDICRVYTTESLKKQFIAIVEHENDMWQSLSNFLETNVSIKKFPRYFSLPDDTGKLVLTRKTVAKTIILERVNPGFSYDKSIWLKQTDKEFDRTLAKKYIASHEATGIKKCFSTNDYQTHLLIETDFRKFYEEFLSKYIFPKGSNFTKNGFEKILDGIVNGEIDSLLTVVIMRYKTNEYRSLLFDGANQIKELPQSYNEGTGYSGDKNLPGLENKMYFQMHLVYTDKNNPQNFIPLLCFNNPWSKKSIKYVTGDNVYESI